MFGGYARGGHNMEGEESNSNEEDPNEDMLESEQSLEGLMPDSSEDHTYEPSNWKVTQRLNKIYPNLCRSRYPLPMMWNNADKANALCITNYGLRVIYGSGASKSSKDAASVKADEPIPCRTGLYYFEVHVVKGVEGFLGIGVCEKGVNPSRLPGWDKFSYGYHGDDGNFFAASGTGRPYGPKFSTGDVVGCGVNFLEKTIFFTKNGTSLGVAMRALERHENLYPTIGLQAAGEIVDVNFGQKPFVYDIEKDMRRMRENVMHSILQVDLPSDKTKWMNHLVMSWLYGEAHTGSIAAMARATCHQKYNLDQEKIEARRNILCSIRCGRITEAMDHIGEHFPSLLQNERFLAIQLDCQAFVHRLMEDLDQKVEDVDGSSRDSNDDGSAERAVPQSAHSKSHELRSTHSHTPNPNKRSHSYTVCPHDVDAPPARRTPPQTDEQAGCSSSNGAASTRNGTSTQNGKSSNGKVFSAADEQNGISKDGEDFFKRLPRKERDVVSDEELASAREILKLGRELYSSAQLPDLKLEQRKEVYTALQCVSVTEQPELRQHPFFSDENLNRLADNVNRAILASQLSGETDVFASSDLHSLLAYLVELKQQLKQSNVLAADFIDLKQLMFGIERDKSTIEEEENEICDENEMDHEPTPQENANVPPQQELSRIL